MQVVVRLFGSLREATGAKELAVTLDADARVADLFALLAAMHVRVADVFDARGAVGVLLRAEPRALIDCR